MISKPRIITDHAQEGTHCGFGVDFSRNLLFGPIGGGVLVIPKIKVCDVDVGEKGFALGEAGFRGGRPEDDDHVLFIGAASHFGGVGGAEGGVPRWAMVAMEGYWGGQLSRR